MADRSTVVVDSSVWVAYFDRDDSHSERAQLLLSSWISSEVPLVVSLFVVQEVATVLLYQGKGLVVNIFLNFLRDQGSIKIVRPDMEFVKAVSLYAENLSWKPKMSFTDWSLAYLAIAMRAELASFDRQLNNAVKRMKGN
ncbi:MAG: PIN domain-containing protein [bacterium]|nr:PIN domain-containing protein [bacterium]